MRATIGGATADVIFAGLTPGFVGLAQVNLVIPNVAPGDQPLEITVGGAKANSTLLSVGGN